MSGSVNLLCKPKNCSGPAFRNERDPLQGSVGTACFSLGISLGNFNTGPLRYTIFTQSESLCRKSSLSMPSMRIVSLPMVISVYCSP